MIGDGVRAVPAEIARSLPGDDLLPDADVVMDRALSLPAPPDQVWPWLVQLGKRRAGWYLPRRLERLLPHDRRAARGIDARWQSLSVGDVIPDYGGRDATFTVAAIERPHHLVHTSQRGHLHLTWALVLEPEDGGTRLHLRLRLGPVKRRVLVTTGGELIDVLTVAGLARGLRERITDDDRTDVGG